MKILRQHHFVLCPGNDRYDLPNWESLLIQIQFLETVLDHTFAVIRIIDGKIFGIADLLDIPPQDADTGGVERRRPYVPGLLPQHPLQTLLQFIGCLVGKGNGQHFPRPGRL